MIGSSTVGPNSPIERVLADYGVDASSWGEDLVEDDTERLLLALLLEHRGENAVEALNPESDDNREAAYFVTEEPLPVTSTDEERLNWGFPATSVTIWGFTERFTSRSARTATSGRSPSSRGTRRITRPHRADSVPRASGLASGVVRRTTRRSS